MLAGECEGVGVREEVDEERVYNYYKLLFAIGVAIYIEEVLISLLLYYCLFA